MTLTNRDVAQDIGLINCNIGFNIACVFYFATVDGKESVTEFSLQKPICCFWIMFLYQTVKYIACFGDEQGIFSIFCSCFLHKQKSILVCLSFQRTSGLLCFHVL